MAKPVEFAGDTIPGIAFGPYLAVVQHVVDGDTVDLIVDVGFHHYTCQRFRLLAAGRRGIDAPEMHGRSKRRGEESKQWLTELIPPGTKVRITTERDPDVYGRYFAIIDVPDRGDAGTLSVEGGHAKWREW